MRRIQICVVYFCFGIIWTVILKKEVKNKFSKIDQADLDSPHRELSNGGLRIIVALLVRWGINFVRISGFRVQIFSRTGVRPVYNQKVCPDALGHFWSRFSKFFVH